MKKDPLDEPLTVEEQLGYDGKKAQRQWQNKINNAQGHIFEQCIKTACLTYAELGRAQVEKIPEPFMVTHKGAGGIFSGRFTALAQPDFQGTIAGGQSVVFEAKYTTTDRLRREVLDRHWKMGESAAVCAGIQDQYFFVPWKVWDGMKERFGRKYVTARDLEPYRVKFNGAVMFLDYIRADRTAWKEEGSEKAKKPNGF